MKVLKILILSLRFSFYFYFAGSVSGLSILVDLDVVDDYLSHEFGIPGKCEGGCVGHFPPR